MPPTPSLPRLIAGRRAGRQRRSGQDKRRDMRWLGNLDGQLASLTSTCRRARREETCHDGRRRIDAASYCWLIFPQRILVIFYQLIKKYNRKCMCSELGTPGTRNRKMTSWKLQITSLLVKKKKFLSCIVSGYLLSRKNAIVYFKTPQIQPSIKGQGKVEMLSHLYNLESSFNPCWPVNISMLNINSVWVHWLIMLLMNSCSTKWKKKTGRSQLIRIAKCLLFRKKALCALGRKWCIKIWQRSTRNVSELPKKIAFVRPKVFSFS